MSITLLGNPVVILNSSNAALKMLDKKSALSSDRPNLPVCGEVIGWDRTLALLHYNHVWRETRRLFLQTIGTRKSLDNLTGQLEFEGRRFVLHLLEAPEQVSQQVRRSAYLSRDWSIMRAQQQRLVGSVVHLFCILPTDMGWRGRTMNSFS